ncbi:LysR family transcriptional regulator [Fluviispira multicolorata]|uniref:LysR family transcriptional regulator n=1 Tax=Fluviispira multicolorata TaxID=2654512 RepID=A0A833N6J1_9BACT|nr:LysR family transcriptional regulator [Fluviispira multicolorata]KAB8030623.1 LysR family transcriptional regulator [Fluviispira multicolorata]
MDYFIKNINIFIEVSKKESITKAALSLKIPKSAVSIGIKKLEEKVGTRLLFRSTRKVSLTQDGIEYLHLCKILLSDIEQIEYLFKKNKNIIKGQLKIDAPSRIACRIIIPNLSKFFTIYPDIKIFLSSSDRFADIIHEGFDFAIRVGELMDSSFIAKPIGNLKMINCVSPNYLKKFGLINTIEDLSKHFIVNYEENSGIKPEFEYMLNGKINYLKINSLISVNNVESYISAAIADLGIIQVPEYDVKEHLKKGELTRILNNFNANTMPISFIYPHKELIPTRMKIFMEWLKKEIELHIE